MMLGTDREFFNKMLRKGKRLSYEELVPLNPVLKKDYFDYILQYDGEVARELVKTHTKVANMYNDNSDVVWGVEDFFDSWNTVQQ